MRIFFEQTAWRRAWPFAVERRKSTIEDERQALFFFLSVGDDDGDREGGAGAESGATLHDFLASFQTYVVPRVFERSISAA